MSVGEYYYVGQKTVEKFMLRLHNILNRMEYHGTLVSNFPKLILLVMLWWNKTYWNHKIYKIKNI